MMMNVLRSIRFPLGGLAWALLAFPLVAQEVPAAAAGKGGFELPTAASINTPPPAPATAPTAAAPAPAPAPLPPPAPGLSPAPAPESVIIPAQKPPSRLDRLSALGAAPAWNQLNAFRQTLSREEFEKAMREVYLDNSPFPPPWQVQQDAVLIPTGQADHPTQRVEFRTNNATQTTPAKAPRYWKKASELPPLKGRPPLSDLHIALDPGHIGGAFGRVEERFLSFKPGEAIQEGDLSLLTAQVLMERLKKLGAYVSLVRDRPEPVTEVRPSDLRQQAIEVLRQAGFPSPEETYDPNAQDPNSKIISVQWQTEKLFYRVSEIHARGVKVNQQIKPDMVLCLHFNAESWGAAAAPQFSPLNHFHVLINGCYAPVELEQQDVRFELMQRVFTGIHDEELPVAESVADGVASVTGLPAYVYTTPNARHSGLNSYVYARNLLANRLYQCPVVYLEPYVMNHEETYRRLLLGHYLGRTLVGGKLQTSAIEDYVQGVVKGLVAYYQNKRSQP